MRKEGFVNFDFMRPFGFWILSEVKSGREISTAEARRDAERRQPRTLALSPSDGEREKTHFAGWGVPRAALVPRWPWAIVFHPFRIFGSSLETSAATVTGEAGRA